MNGQKQGTTDTVEWNGIQFCTGLLPITGDGPLDELGMMPCGPERHDNGAVKMGYLAQESTIQGIRISKHRCVWFHPDGNLWIVKGTGLSQHLFDKDLGPNDEIWLRPDGQLEKIVKPSVSK